MMENESLIVYKEREPLPIHELINKKNVIMSIGIAIKFLVHGIKIKWLTCPHE